MFMHKKYINKKVFNKIGGLGFNQKSIQIKSFNDNKGFKFGKINGFKDEKALITGFGLK